MSNVFVLPMHSKDKVQLTGIHDRQGLDGTSNKDSFDLREYLDCFLMLINSIRSFRARPYKHLKVKNRILNFIRYLIGSQ